MQREAEARRDVDGETFARERRHVGVKNSLRICQRKGDIEQYAFDGERSR
jgi:hypothetical protein